MTNPLAGKPAPTHILADIPALVSAYFRQTPDAGARAQRVAFGTSGHRGSSLSQSFNELHIAAIAKAIAEHRASRGVTGPLFVGRDTHALSRPAFVTLLEVLVAHDVEVMIDAADGYTPTPAVSHAILEYNKDRQGQWADGVVITPSHNPPEDGGIKYDPPHGGPAAGDETKAIENRANEILAEGLQSIARISWKAALDKAHPFDFITPYVTQLAEVVDMVAISKAKLSIGVDPMGGSGVGYWDPIAETYGLELEVLREEVDPTFRFMCVDKDGRIRMDCSSPYAMAGLVELKDRFDIAFGNDTDFDRHGIVTRTGGLMNPNHYLAVCVKYLFETREWPGASVGKTLVSSSMIDRVATEIGRPLYEVPVGFKHFVDGLRSGALGFGGEESAGASFLRKDGTVWTTDKDGILLDLLAAEITAKTGKNPHEHYQALTEVHGAPVYERLDAPATPEQKAALSRLAPEQVSADTLAGDAIISKHTRASGNDASIGGLKVSTERGWFAARPSGTEAKYKIYAESFEGEEHLKAIQSEAQEIVSACME